MKEGRINAIHRRINGVRSDLNVAGTGQTWRHRQGPISMRDQAGER